MSAPDTAHNPEDAAYVAKLVSIAEDPLVRPSVRVAARTALKAIRDGRPWPIPEE